MTEQLNLPTKIINSNNMEYPEEIKVCELSEPLCNSYIKARNYYMARPYNFMMLPEHWEKVTNQIELLMAVRFGMEFDMNKFGDNIIYQSSFHTQMYIKFHNYLNKHAMKDVAKIVAEFQQTAFTMRFKSTFAIHELAFLKSNIDKLNILTAIDNVRALSINAGPLTINRNMYKNVFRQDFHPQMVEQLIQNRIYRGDPNNIKFGKL